MNKDKQTKAKQALDIEGIQSPQIWPLWPLLPLKHWKDKDDTGFPLLGVLWEEDRVQHGGYRVAVGINYMLFAGSSVEGRDYQVKTYRTLPDLVEDWKVD